MMKKFLLAAGKKLKRIAQAGKKRYANLWGRSGQETPLEAKIVSKTQKAENLSLAQVKGKDDGASKVTGRKAQKPSKQPTGHAWSLDDFLVPAQEGKSRFHDYAIPLSVMQAIAELGFQYCTPIQEKALTEVLVGKDLVGKANTGTGKTAVFLIAVLARLLGEKEVGKKANRGIQALILAPTRELVMQIAKDGENLSRHCGISICPVFGGVDYHKQLDVLKGHLCDVVVATPGRLLDFITKGVADLSNCRILVLDEADRMLDMGFIPDVRRIVGRLPAREERQTLLFSATVSEDVQRLASQWCVHPKMVEAEPDQMAVDTIEQVVYLTTIEEKYFILYNLIKRYPEERIMVFVNMKNEAKRLVLRLQRNGVDCLLLSGDVEQVKRANRMESFRAGKVKVLVATDVAGRGIHIEGITFVVNYTLPYEPEDYVHRIGRTGRAGARGRAVSFACEEGSFYLPDIEQLLNKKLPCTTPEDYLVVPPPKGSAQPVRPASLRTQAGEVPKPSRRRRRPSGRSRVHADKGKNIVK